MSGHGNIKDIDKDIDNDALVGLGSGTEARGSTP
jgi:hypothetical protein